MADADADPKNTGSQQATPLIGADGNFRENWHQDPLIPENLRVSPTLANTKSISALVSQLDAAERMVGADKIAIPGKNSTPEDVRNVMGKLGLPKDVAGYVDDKGQPILARPEGVPDELWSDDNNKEFGEFAFKEAMLLPWQLKKINDWYNNRVVTGYKKQQDEEKQAMVAFEAELNKSWGKARPEILKQVDMVLARYFEKKPESFQRLQQAGILKNMDFVGFLSDIAKDLDIDKGRGMGITSMTPGDITTQIKDLQNSAAYKDPNHPQNREVTEKVTKLFEALEQAKA